MAHVVAVVGERAASAQVIGVDREQNGDVGDRARRAQEHVEHVLAIEGAVQGAGGIRRIQGGDGLRSGFAAHARES